MSCRAVFRLLPRALMARVTLGARAAVAAPQPLMRSFATASAAAGQQVQSFLDRKEVSERVLGVLKGFEKVDPAKLSGTAHFSNELGLDSLDAVEVRTCAQCWRNTAASVARRRSVESQQLARGFQWRQIAAHQAGHDRLTSLASLFSCSPRRSASRWRRSFASRSPTLRPRRSCRSRMPSTLSQLTLRPSRARK